MKVGGCPRQQAIRALWARFRLPRIALLALLLLVWGARAEAVTFDRQAERLQLIYSFLLDFRPAQAPIVPDKTQIELALDLIPAPSIDNRVGGKSEPVDPPEIIPRPRVRLHLKSGLVLGAAYTPPLEVSGYEANMVAADVQYRFRVGNWRVGLRGFALDGEVEGPVTDPDADDRFEVTNVGGDLLLGLQVVSWTPYLGVGAGRTRSTLTIRADGVELETDEGYSYFIAGITLDAAPLRFTLEQTRTETILDHITFSLSLLF